ncbi:MAG: hypothetical protein JO257_21750 [Deltaproteobacteria bacterium]|nr:hypothetical protein [Deltaproteobacteria bacterium]
MAPIVFVGIVGNQHAAVERQLEPSLEKAGVTEMAIPDGERTQLVKHTKTAKQVVKSLHVGGVIAGELTGKGNDRSFRVIIYDGEGNLTSDLESPIGAKKLTPHNIDVFETNIADIAASGSAPAPKAKTAVAKRQAAPTRDQPHLTDDDAPPGMPGSKPAAAPAPSHPPVAVADDDSAAATADAPAVVAHAPEKPGDHGVHVHIGVLLGMVGRSLSTDPNTIKAYTSSPVATGGFAGGVDIGARIHLAGSFEHTLVMHSDVGGMNASSNIGRFEGAVAYDIVNGGVQLAPIVGIGERYFAIDSTSTSRTADLQYVYVVLGATVAKPIGSRWALRGTAAFEPVFTGLRPASLPGPARWGVDVGASLDVKATAHVFARAALDYQVFQSSYDMTGNTVDGYYGGSLSAGAAF